MISRSEMADLQEEIFEKLRIVRAAGQAEYAHDESNAMANFERLAADLGISREKVLWIYLRKHLDGILAHINGYTSQREPVDGRLKDAIMYLILLWGMVEDNKLPDTSIPRRPIG